VRPEKARKELVKRGNSTFGFLALIAKLNAHILKYLWPKN
jgi:hypothetical protein